MFGGVYLILLCVGWFIVFAWVCSGWFCVVSLFYVFV